MADGRLHEARDELRAAAKQGVHHPQVLLLRGLVEASLGNPDKADRAFAGALALDPTLARAHLGRGRLALERGDENRAAEELRLALTLKPDAFVARDLGFLLLNSLGDPVGAREAFARALALEPNGPEAPALRQILALLEGKEPEVEITP
jgi:Flp pilus assembly protein TadD